MLFYETARASKRHSQTVHGATGRRGRPITIPRPIHRPPNAVYTRRFSGAPNRVTLIHHFPSDSNCTANPTRWDPARRSSPRRSKGRGHVAPRGVVSGPNDAPGHPTPFYLRRLHDGANDHLRAAFLVIEPHGFASTPLRLTSVRHLPFRDDRPAPIDRLRSCVATPMPWSTARRSSPRRSQGRWPAAELAPRRVGGATSHTRGVASPPSSTFQLTSPHP